MSPTTTIFLLLLLSLVLPIMLLFCALHYIKVSKTAVGRNIGMQASWEVNYELQTFASRSSCSSSSSSSSESCCHDKREVDLEAGRMPKMAVFEAAREGETASIRLVTE
ncbi:hypothetical protein FN846DRAFT_901908 [Sphaerosporella brunnea]|uniref:Uncharacterized protein n=1 Tax=Sphaerosporella brunnea TaxID=1250544 RepID=A0A5J5FAM9_9PEZI|nr:hypothetical protein FN846DRAFT_901908 [Sphaerosporella brunnea]